MKCIRKSPEEPQELIQYKSRFANRPTPPTWNEFKKSPDRVGPVKDSLRRDQLGLCAYCEVSLTSDNQSVEHLVPRSLDHSRELDWQNILLICLGDEKAPPPKELSCGQARNQARSPEVLNPLRIPPGEPLFAVESQNGKLSVDEKSCGRACVSPELVRSTIISLNLVADRLSMARLRLVETLEEEIKSLVDSGQSFPEAEKIVAAQQFQPNMPWPQFFTTIRCNLGNAAENRLREINFEG